MHPDETISRASPGQFCNTRSAYCLTFFFASRPTLFNLVTGGNFSFFAGSKPAWHFHVEGIKTGLAKTAFITDFLMLRIVRLVAATLVVTPISFMCPFDSIDFKHLNDVLWFVNLEDNGVGSPDVHTINLCWFM